MADGVLVDWQLHNGLSWLFFFRFFCSRLVVIVFLNFFFVLLFLFAFVFLTINILLTNIRLDCLLLLIFLFFLFLLSIVHFGFLTLLTVHFEVACHACNRLDQGSWSEYSNHLLQHLRADRKSTRLNSSH